MKYFDAFTGYGGFTLAINNAYNLYDTKRIQQGNSKPDLSANKRECLATKQLSCVGFSEIDKYACKVYQFQFPNHKNYGSITDIDEKGLPDFDLFMGGFPCQSFSIAGNRGGFADTRGTLIFDILRICNHKKPKHILLENVKGLLSHDNGRTFSTIIEAIQEIGYGVSWKVLNAKDFGVPQNRERVFILCTRGEPSPEILPIWEPGQKNNAEIKQFIRANKKGKIKNKEIASCLTGGGHSGGNHRDMDLLFKEKSIRRLTPLECERLMGLPDNWTKQGTDGEISDTQRYKLCGNGVVVNCVEAIINQLQND